MKFATSLESTLRWILAILGVIYFIFIIGFMVDSWSRISPENELMFIQTLVLMGTGAVVAWYTYETQLIRYKSQEQVALTRASLEFAESERRRLLQPHMRLSPILTKEIEDGVQIAITNLGHTAYNFELWVPEEDTMQVLDNLPDPLHRDETRVTRIVWPNLKSVSHFEFTVSYDDYDEQEFFEAWEWTPEKGPVRTDKVKPNRASTQAQVNFKRLQI